MKKLFSLLLFGLSFSQPVLAQNDVYVKEYSQAPETSKYYLGFAGGINNYTGLIGPTLEYRLTEKFAPYAGVGLGSWGNKISAGIKYYPEFPGRWAFNLGFSHSTGLPKVEIDMPAQYLYSGVEAKVPFRLKSAKTINVSAVRYWMLGRDKRNRFNLEFGYAFPGEENRYEVLSTHALNPTGMYFMNIMQPGGLILGLGFSFAL